MLDYPCAGEPAPVEWMSRKTGKYETYYMPHIRITAFTGEFLEMLFKTKDEAETAARVKAAELRQPKGK